MAIHRARHPNPLNTFSCLLLLSGCRLPLASTCCCLSRPGPDRQIGAHLATSTSYLIPVLDCISASSRQLPTVDFIFGSDGACVVLQNNLQPARRRGEPSTLAGLPVRTSPRSRPGSGVLPSLRTLLERLSRLDDAAQDREGEWLPPPISFADDLQPGNRPSGSVASSAPLPMLHPLQHCIVRLHWQGATVAGPPRQNGGI